MSKVGLAINNLYNQPKKKISYYLNQYQSKQVLFIFDHGLGDLIEFLPIFLTIEKEFPKWNFKIGINKDLNLSFFNKNIVNLRCTNMSVDSKFMPSPVLNLEMDTKYNIPDLQDEYDFIFNIRFLDPRSIKDNINENHIYKIHYCLENEFGYPFNKKLEQYNPDFSYLIDKNIRDRVCIHCGGHTDKAIKNPSYDIYENIWNEVKQAGFKPFDIHVNNVSKVPGTTIELPSFIKPEESIRNIKNINMEILVKTIINSNYLIGILSGPLHLATSIFRDNPNKIIGLQKKLNLLQYISRFPINVVDVNNYEKNTIYNLLKKGQIYS